MCRTPTSLGFCETLELRGSVVGLEIDPPDDSGHERIRLGELEQPSRFFERLASLHCDTGIDGGAIHLSPGVSRQKIPAQRGHRVVDPAVVAGRVAPEMLM